jgi:hypothetical protein
VWLQQCCNFKIPRFFIKDLPENHIKQLWAFSDVSYQAECIVIYYRLMNHEREQINLSLIMGKNFVVPKNAVRTIPELELDAALRAVIWLKKMIELHPKIKFDEIHPAVDNSSVFIWLIFGGQKPTVFDKNRLKTISETNLEINYRWVSTEFQAADYGTKFSSLPLLQ